MITPIAKNIKLITNEKNENRPIEQHVLNRAVNIPRTPTRTVRPQEDIRPQNTTFLM